MAVVLFFLVCRAVPGAAGCRSPAVRLWTAGVVDGWDRPARSGRASRTAPASSPGRGARGPYGGGGIGGMVGTGERTGAMAVRRYTAMP
ncbi:hypothetical protein GCM10010405_08630 [Streptomyces macrosporus]|uniref:Secreted protein n=1 Tax=Streptomyces macrosporus TaxID=44032 RepID=A0ABP5WM31_9ACTN